MIAQARAAADTLALMHRHFAQAGCPLPVSRDDGITIPLPPGGWARKPAPVYAATELQLQRREIAP